MSGIDVARILEPVAADQPCGVDLEYDADFLAMVQAATPKPERQMGAEVIPAEDPNWRDVKVLAAKLLLRSKDLRVAVLLCHALLHSDGIAGFAPGLQVVRGLLEKFWPGLFPLLDADDDNDPTMRVNTLLGLADLGGVLRSLREAPLVSARAAGNFGLREVDAAAGRGTVAGKAPTPELIRAAFQEVELSAIQATRAAVAQARDELRAIDAALQGHLSGMAPDLRPLAGVLDSQARELEQQLQLRGGGTLPAAAADGTPAPASGAAAAGPPASVQSRNDVLHWIDRICEFYNRHEPSSPVPLLLQRARRLVNMSFLDVVKDLVPDGLNQAHVFRGQTEEG